MIIKRRDFGLPAKDAEAKAHRLSARIMETIIARGILAGNGFSPGGLKKGVTAEMTQYGQAALERTAAPSSVMVMDLVHERVLSTERSDEALRRIAKEKIIVSFTVKVHVLAYIGVNIFLILLNYFVTSPGKNDWAIIVINLITNLSGKHSPQVKVWPFTPY